MAVELDRLIEWAVGSLGQAGAEGLSISNLFERLEIEFDAGDVTKNGVWDGLLAREDVILGGDKKQIPLSKSPLKKLALEDLSLLGLKERKICIKRHEKPIPALVNGVEAPGAAVEQRSSAATKRKATEELLSASPAKRHESGSSSPKKAADTHTQIIKRTPRKASATSRLDEASPGPRPIREAIFTSQADLDREAGLSGVYMNPIGSAKPLDPQQRGRPKKSCILVFKSAKLRVPEWFEKTKNDADLIRVAEGVAQSIIEAEDTPVSKRKPRNRHRKRQSTGEAGEVAPRKRQKTSKSPEHESMLEALLNPLERLNPSVQSQGVTELEVENLQAPCALSLGDDSQQKNGASPANVTPIPSDAAVSTPSSAPIAPRAPHAPSSTRTSPLVLPPQNTAPHPQSMLAQILAQPTPSYISPFGSYASPYASPRASQKTATLPHTIPSANASHPVSQPYQQLSTSPHSAPLTETPQSLSQRNQQQVVLSQPVPSQVISQSAQQPSQEPSILLHPVYTTDTPRPDMQTYEQAATLEPASSTKSSLATQTPAQGPPRGFFSQPPPDPLLWNELFTPKRLPNGQASVSPARRLSSEETRETRVSPINSQAAATQVMPTPKKRRPKSQQDPELVTKLAQAESITPPEGATRLACVFQELCGNLLLSKDYSLLEFVWAIQPPPETCALVLPISQVTQNPITSMPGSKPMELRIKARDDKGEDVTHCFIFAGTDTGIAAANAMRAKIVTALIAFQFRNGGSWQSPGDIKHERLKPFKCDKCELRFKNKGGLDYHITKSNTSCNPNCDLKLLAEKRSKAEKRTIRTPKPPKPPKAPKEPKVSRTPRKKKDQTEAVTPEQQNTPLDVQGGDQSDSTASSEDSIIEFWKQNSTIGVERPRLAKFGATTTVSPSKSKVYKALPFEPSVLREIAQEMAALTEKAKEVDNTYTEGLAGSAEPSHTPQQLDTQRCEEILLSLVHDNDDIFPGDRSIWIAFVAVWLKKHTGSLILPESKLCSKTVDELIESKRLNSTVFTFIDPKKRAITRTILTIPGSRVNSEQIDLMKELIKVSHPAFYVPSKFAPPEAALSKLIALATRTIVDRDKYRAQEPADMESQSTDSRSQSPIEFDDESSDDEFLGDEEDDDLDDLGSDGEERTESENEQNEKSDESHDEGVTGHLWTRKRTARHNANISKGVRRAWAAMKARRASGIISGFFPNRKSRKGKVPLTQEQKDKRVVDAFLLQRSWDAAPAFMPNPETGAWDQVPPKPKKSKKGCSRENRPRVYPITFLQAPNGAWSISPFGHGVKPVYARPSKRVYGNPTGEAYEWKRDNGHRPVIHPTKNRKSGPQGPSKNLSNGKSQKTGKPVRKYKKKATLSQSPQSPDSEEVQELVTSKGKPSDRSWLFPKWVPNDEPRESSRDTNVFDEVYLLNFFEPKKLAPDAPRNPGLETVPPNFGLDASKYEGPDPEELEYLSGYRTIKFIDPNIVEESLSPFQGSWTVGAWSPCVAEDFNVRWDDATAFDSETIPYDHLYVGSANPEGEPVDDELPLRKRRKQQFVPPQPGPKKLTLAEKYSFVRVLTSLPTDFEGILDNPDDATKEFGIELAPPNEATANGRRIKGARAVMAPEVEKRFIITVVVIRTLTGGIEARIDWVIVSQYFQDYSCNFLMKYWMKIQKVRNNVIESLVSDFQEAFLPAYQSGEIPQLDYDHLVDYDWPSLIDWVTTNVDVTLRTKSIKLPGSKQEVKQMYDLTELDPDPNRWRENFFGQLMPIYRRIEVAAAEPSTIPPEQESSSGDVDSLRVARSWVRAAVLTPQEHFDQSIATEKMHQLGNPLVKEVIQGFTCKKGIVKRARKQKETGRQYEASDFFWIPFRRNIKEKVFIEAAAFKHFLDEQFSSGAECVRHDYMANEGAIMVTTTLQAQGRVRLELMDVPLEKMGLTDGGYETKSIEREKFIFNMDIYPTDSYVYDSDNEFLRSFLESEPPRGPETGEIPVWYGICDVSIAEIWKKVLVAVGQTVALRSGINMSQLKKIFKPSMEEWEIRILMDWGTERGFFKRLHESIEGWTVGEDWWLVVARVCADG